MDVENLGKILISVGVGLIIGDIIEHTVLGVKFNPKQIHHGYIGAILALAGLGFELKKRGLGLGVFC